jgi:outer membrane scaffolding protein for murein synthesis (MipA/OmpV family)
MRFIAIAALGIVGIASAEEAAPLPLWEFGFGAAPLSVSEYRGTNTRREFLLPLPYVIYRGDVLKFDRDGLRGILLESDDFEINLSVNATWPVRSDADSPRAGMPELDPIVEAGVSLNWDLRRGERSRLRLRVPIRGALATDLKSVDHVGWKIEPHLQLETRERPGEWRLGVGTGPLFADSAYHEYFYGVAPSYARPDRPVYAASGGYSGWTLLGSASRRLDNWWIGGFLRYDNLSGATFEDSPLVETSHAMMVGLAVAWIFGESETSVPAEW